MNSYDFSPFPVFLTDRLYLRRIGSGDEESLFILRSNKQVMQYLDRPMAETINDARELIKKIDGGIVENNAVTWAVTLKERKELIGTIGFWRIIKEHFRAEVGFLLHPDYQGAGIMNEALGRVLEYGFDTLGLHSVEADVNPRNSSSIKLLERNGFVKEAYFRENFFFDGRFLDSAVYSLLSRDR